MNDSVYSQTVPTDAGAKADERSGYGWWYVLAVAREHRRELVVAHIVAGLAVLANLPIPLLMPLLVDEVLLEQPGPLVGGINSLFPATWQGPVLYILAILLLTVILRVAGVALGVWQTRKFTLVAKDVTYRMRRELLARLQRVAMGEYETMGSGAVASRFVTDVNAVDEFVGTSVSKTVIAVLSLVGVSVVLLWMHWQLALFILLMNPVVIYFTVLLGKRVKQLKQRENRAFELFQQALVETLDALQQIRASNREGRYLGQVMDRARDIREHSAAFSWQSDAANRASFGVFLLGFDLFRAVSMLMVVFSDLSVGQMMAVFGYLWFMMTPVQDLLNIQYSYYAARAGLARINDLLALDEEPYYPHLRDPFQGKTTVGVAVERVSFAYGDSPEVLKDVSLRIPPGGKVAVVGASGAGKSTLVQIILGLYAPQGGMLYFDGVPVTDIGLDVVREHVATVLQQPAMLNDSVRANLALTGDTGDEALWQALEVAQLKEVVAAMPEGLDSIIGRHGVRLSGGQQQRMAIARMVLQDPKVVILDEATSALDTNTEARLHQALRQFLQDRTTLIIAHRLSAVRQADRVYVLDDGHVVEQGVHDELIQQPGPYQRLYGPQSPTE